MKGTGLPGSLCTFKSWDWCWISAVSNRGRCFPSMDTWVRTWVDVSNPLGRLHPGILVNIRSNRRLCNPHSLHGVPHSHGTLCIYTSTRDRFWHSLPFRKFLGTHIRYILLCFLITLYFSIHVIYHTVFLPPFSVFSLLPVRLLQATCFLVLVFLVLLLS